MLACDLTGIIFWDWLFWVENIHHNMVKTQKMPSWELTYPLKRAHLKIIFPFPKLGYVIVPWRVAPTFLPFLNDAIFFLSHFFSSMLREILAETSAGRDPKLKQDFHEWGDITILYQHKPKICVSKMGLVSNANADQINNINFVWMG